MANISGGLNPVLKIIRQNGKVEFIPNELQIKSLYEALDPDYLPAFNEYVSVINKLKSNNKPYDKVTMCLWLEDNKLVFEW